MKLWLDDVRDPATYHCIGYTWVKTAVEAMELLLTGEVTFASLDHDLTIKATMGDWEGELTGYEVVVWMRNRNIWPRDGVAVHSLNQKGAKRMRAVIAAHYGGRIFPSVVRLKD